MEQNERAKRLYKSRAIASPCVSLACVLSNYYKLVAICKREDVKDERKQPWSAFCASYTDNMESVSLIFREILRQERERRRRRRLASRTQNASNPAAGEGVRKKLDHLEM